MRWSVSFSPLAIAFLVGCASPYSLKIPVSRIPEQPSHETMEALSLRWLAATTPTDGMSIRGWWPPVRAFICDGQPWLRYRIGEVGWRWGAIIDGGEGPGRLHLFFLSETGRFIGWHGRTPPRKTYVYDMRVDQVQDPREPERMEL